MGCQKKFNSKKHAELHTNNSVRFIHILATCNYLPHSKDEYAELNSKLSCFFFFFSPLGYS